MCGPCSGKPVAAAVPAGRVGAVAVLAVVVVVALLYVFYKNVVPVPPSPYNLLPYVFAGALLLGLAWLLYVRATAPGAVRDVGTTEEDPVPVETVRTERAPGRDRPTDRV